MPRKAPQPAAAEGRHPSVLRRLSPPLAFLVALCLMVLCFYDSGYTSLPPTGKRYDIAKASIESLRLDEKRANQRAPWEKLAAEFRAIYDADPGWPNRPAALFRSAESLEELARHSFAKADARRAIECYEAVAQQHADSRLADDALLRAAKLHASWLKDDKGALVLLRRIKNQYPNGDMVGEAAALEKNLLIGATDRAASESRPLSGMTGKEPTEVAPVSDMARDTNSLLNSAAAMPPLPQAELLPRYHKAKERMEALCADKVRLCWRQPWEVLATDFLRIYQGRKNWVIAPGALYRAAASLEKLADCSHMADDYRQAQNLYLQLAQEFPKSALADDSLLHAAIIHADRLDQPAEALKLLHAITTRYANGDMLSQTRALHTRLSPPTPSGKTAGASPLSTGAAQTQASSPQVSRSELKALSWTSLSKNSVEIVLEMSSPARFSAKLETPTERGARSGSPNLQISIENAAVVSDVRKGLHIQGSLLKSLNVREGKSGEALLLFSFRDARRFDSRVESNPCRIILRVAAGTTLLPPLTPGKAGFAENQELLPVPQAPLEKAGQSPGTNAAARMFNNMANQLGLTVRTVFLDAGHGGRDPGTNHNNVLERAVTLDIALTLGRLLEANGMNVVYSRTKDKSLSLRDRTTMANAAGADLFISIHVNANEDPSVEGLETYYLDLASNPEAARLATLENADSDHRLSDMQKMLADVVLNARIGESRHLAQDVQRLTLFRLGKHQFNTRDNGVKSAPFMVLLGAHMPAVLIELGYCTSKTEARNLLNPKFRMALAEGLAEGILAYKDRLLKRRTVQNSLTQESAGAM